MAERKVMLTDDDKYELINLWEGEDILYDICNADYRNKPKRNAAVKRIAEEMTADISDDEVKNTMKNLNFLGHSILTPALSSCMHY